MRPHLSELFPEHSGPGKMTTIWWARYGLEEAAMDAGDVEGEFPAHDRLADLMAGRVVAVPVVT